MSFFRELHVRKGIYKQVLNKKYTLQDLSPDIQQKAWPFQWGTEKGPKYIFWSIDILT